MFYFSCLPRRKPWVIRCLSLLNCRKVEWISGTDRKSGERGATFFRVSGNAFWPQRKAFGKTQQRVLAEGSHPAPWGVNKRASMVWLLRPWRPVGADDVCYGKGSFGSAPYRDGRG